MFAYSHLPLKQTTGVVIHLWLLLLITQNIAAATAAAVAPAVAAKGIRDGRIVGGEETTINVFPYQVSLQLNNSHMCGGAIISQWHVLTAAHCILQSEPLQLYTIRAGATQHARGGEVLAIKTFIVHPKYNQPTTMNNDIALAVLATPLTYGPTVQPIALFGSGEILPWRADLLVSGWGATTSAGQNVAPSLRFVHIQAFEQARCMRAYHRLVTVTSNMLCAGTERGGRDSCQGDSGGPLVTIMGGVRKLLGIVSWGIGCADARYPGVYTRVSQYHQWLNETVQATMSL